MFQVKVVEKIKTHILCSVTLFEKRTVYEKMWTKKINIAERGRPQMAVWCMRIACWITKVANTLRLRNIHCFSTATMAVRPHLNVTLYVHWLSCWMLNLLVPQVTRRFEKVKQRVLGVYFWGRKGTSNFICWDGGALEVKRFMEEPGVQRAWYVSGNRTRRLPSDFVHA